jgi:CrcB protein
MWQQSILVLIGSGIGGVCRFWTSTFAAALLGKQFPYGTLIVNTAGCFSMGLLFVVILERAHPSLTDPLRALLLTGFLGGLTTFSSFSIESINLFLQQSPTAGFINIFSNVLLCLFFALLGVVIGKLL